MKSHGKALGRHRVRPRLQAEQMAWGSEGLGSRGRGGRLNLLSRCKQGSPDNVSAADSGVGVLLSKKFYLFERFRDRSSFTGSLPNSGSGQGLTRPKQRAGGWIQLYHVGGRDPTA